MFQDPYEQTLRRHISDADRGPTLWEATRNLWRAGRVLFYVVIPTLTISYTIYQGVRPLVAGEIERRMKTTIELYSVTPGQFKKAGEANAKELRKTRGWQRSTKQALDQIATDRQDDQADIRKFKDRQIKILKLLRLLRDRGRLRASPRVVPRRRARRRARRRTRRTRNYSR